MRKKDFHVQMTTARIEFNGSSTQSLFGVRNQQRLNFKRRKDSERLSIESQYKTLGFISSGTYGNVFKAKKINSEFKDSKVYAIKKFKPEKEGDAALSSGVSQSACREIGLCRELHHENIVNLEQVIIDPNDRSIAMVFDYADHDLLVF